MDLSMIVQLVAALPVREVVFVSSGRRQEIRLVLSEPRPSGQRARVVN